MAKHTTVTLVDDLDGSPAEESIAFSLDGRSYEIDLSAANHATLRATLAPYLSAARRLSAQGATASAPGSGRSAADRAHNHAVRVWALAQGMTISARGRIPSSVLTAYHQAH